MGHHSINPFTSNLNIQSKMRPKIVLNMKKISKEEEERKSGV